MEKMRYISTKSDKVFDVVNVVIITLLTLILLYPIVFVVNASFSNPNKIYEVPLLLWPRGFNVTDIPKF